MGIVIGILILSVLMFLHELGHYITGRLLGFKIIEFSLFMGPVLFSKTSKKTGIKYSIKLFPIGASVRFLGEEGMGEDPSENRDSFVKKEKWKRAVVIGTGPTVNIVSAIIALIILFSSVGIVTTRVDEVMEDSQAQAAGIGEGEKVVSLNNLRIGTSIDFALETQLMPPDRKSEVVTLSPDGTKNKYTLVPEKRTGYRLGITIEFVNEAQAWRILDVDPESNEGSPVIREGDIIFEVEGVPTSDREGASSMIDKSRGEPVSVLLERNGEQITVETVPMLHEYYTPIGVFFEQDEGFVPAVGESFKYSVSIVKLTFRSISKIFTGEIAARDSLAGPVGVVSMVGSVVDQTATAREKVFELLWIFALISLNLGVLNLLPIPALDGSHLILIGIEAVRGKRLSPKVENAIVMIGFMFIISIAIIALIFDILRITG